MASEPAPVPSQEVRRGLSPEARLILAGCAVLFWELVLIRWMGSCIRVVSYYTNLVLIAAFLGLGAGALLARRGLALAQWIIPALCLVVALAPFLGAFAHSNPSAAQEYVWWGGPAGVAYGATQEHLLTDITGLTLPYWLVLLAAYLASAAAFLLLGEWLGRLFTLLPPLRAYTAEIGGSLAGVLLFALVSWLNLPPTVWFALGFALVVPFVEGAPSRRRLWTVLAIVVVVGSQPFAGRFLWSRYYKIATQPLQAVWDFESGRPIRFPAPVGRTLTVNNDYHQMIVDLRPRGPEHPFLASWRALYDLPYQAARERPPGPVLVVGAGTGNDVSAALRAGVSRVDAVEIDPLIVDLGRRYHPEAPYGDPRVRVVVNDARSHFVRSQARYALVVFGFLDSHRLISSFSSVRLDNFVYTRESMEHVKQLLLPGGTVAVTFASNTPWIHDRLVALMDAVFDGPTEIFRNTSDRYTNGIVYVNRRQAGAAPRVTASPAPTVKVTEDDWPFLYVPRPSLPGHYRVFMVVVVASGLAALLLLPRGERKIRLPYFFLGAGFFLIETSNVVSLSLLYGSTWIVNVTVFAGILLLILLANLASARFPGIDLRLAFAALLASVLVAYLTPVSALLALRPAPLQAAAAVVVFLGPVFFAGLIFARLIAAEAALTSAYGSNLLGAVIGGCCEYLSVLIGLRALLLVTLAFYLLALATLWTIGRLRGLSAA